MLSLEEYNETFSCDLSPEAFNAIMGSSVRWQDAEELIFVDAETHEKTVFRRVKQGKWSKHPNGSGTCCVCGFWVDDVWDMDGWINFCPHCGADMREVSS